MQKFTSPLFNKMVGNNEHRFIGQPKSFEFHTGSHHFICFSCTNYVCKKNIMTIKNMSNGIFLMFSQFYHRVHVWKSEMTAIIFTRSNTVEICVIDFRQSISSFHILPYPFHKRFLDRVLFLLSNHCFFFIKNGNFFTIIIVFIIKYLC